MGAPLPMSLSGSWSCRKEDDRTLEVPIEDRSKRCPRSQRSLFSIMASSRAQFPPLMVVRLGQTGYHETHTMLSVMVAHDFITKSTNVNIFVLFDDLLLSEETSGIPCQGKKF